MSHIHVLFIMFFGFVVVYAWLMYYFVERQRRVEDRFVQQAKGTEGALSALDALEFWWDSSLPRAATRALKHVLPTLGPDDLLRLDPKHRRRLYSLLRSQCSDDLQIVVLHAIERLCPRESEDDVEWISQFGRTLEVRRAAFHCLDVMRER